MYGRTAQGSFFILAPSPPRGKSQKLRATGNRSPVAPLECGRGGIGRRSRLGAGWRQNPSWEFDPPRPQFRIEYDSQKWRGNMTIAACYLSPEGVVFGADSTTTLGNHYYNHAQKIFEIGEASTLGVVIWGLGGLGEYSYRTLIHEFGRSLHAQPAPDVLDIANRFGQAFWSQFTQRMAQPIQRYQQLVAQAQLSQTEAQEKESLFRTLSGGFCIGGNLHHDPTPRAFVISYNPAMQSANVQALPMHVPMFWGQPNLIQRLAAGIDEELFRDILQSGRWNGTAQDLLNLVNQRRLAIPGVVPIREAIDWVHASLYSTIKAMKFSQLAPACGGPIEIAVITTDRTFRWVRHKTFDAAIPYAESKHA
jgi:hypothetical protein